MLARLFLKHPNSVGETYAQHFISAAGFGVSMVAAGFACLAHAIFPNLFVTTGSDAISRLHDRMVLNRQRHSGKAMGRSRQAK